ncbi:Hypothetical predicted protein [Paramuricea clavata]|uniref:Uncharacterized protein n=1 Tax=Paramuricea clavata TaxID=317549 RepID=A0A6S7G3I6_PARCT|nr:Hypothetical predicted protein [Paramuricea clavata]
MRLEILENSAIIGNNKIRTLIPKDGGKIYFMAKEVASALGYKNTVDAVARHTDERSRNILRNIRAAGNTLLPSMHPDTVFITESGIYELVFGSKLPTARDFKWWIVDEVIPSIRKTGTYTLPGVLNRIKGIGDMELCKLSVGDKVEARGEFVHKGNIVKDPGAVSRGKKGGLAVQKNIRRTKEISRERGARILELEKERDDLEEELDVLTDERDDLIEERDNITEERNGLEEEWNEARQRVHDLEVEMDEKDERVRELEDENDELRTSDKC